MDKVTMNVSAHIKSKGISIAAVSAATGIKYNSLWNSMSGTRALKSGELLKICEFLEKDPLTFA